MYKRILVPFDGSPTSNEGLDEAVKLAKLTGASIDSLHVLTAFQPVAPASVGPPRHADRDRLEGPAEEASRRGSRRSGRHLPQETFESGSATWSPSRLRHGTPTSSSSARRAARCEAPAHRAAMPTDRPHGVGAGALCGWQWPKLQRVRHWHGSIGSPTTTDPQLQAVRHDRLRTSTKTSTAGRVVFIDESASADDPRDGGPRKTVRARWRAGAGQGQVQLPGRAAQVAADVLKFAASLEQRSAPTSAPCSSAMKQSKIVRDDQSEPLPGRLMKAVPDTTMTYDGVVTGRSVPI